MLACLNKQRKRRRNSVRVGGVDECELVGVEGKGVLLYVTVAITSQRHSPSVYCAVPEARDYSEWVTLMTLFPSIDDHRPAEP